MTEKRRTRKIGIVVGALLVLAALVWWRSRSRRPLGPPYAFDVCVLHKNGTPAGRNAWNEAVLASVARTLTPEERASLEEALAQSITRWEAKANPLLEDLEGGDPDGPLVTWFKKGPTFLKTAQASARLRVCSPDGFCVIPRSPSGICPEGTAPPVDANEADRARFLSWAWGYALRFKAKSPEAARAAAATLREQVRTSRALAIVISSDDAEVTQHEPFATIRERWQKIGALKAVAHHDKTPAPTGFAVGVAPDEVVVLPRHDVMSTGQPAQIVESEVLNITPELTAKR